MSTSNQSENNINTRELMCDKQALQIKVDTLNFKLSKQTEESGGTIQSLHKKIEILTIVNDDLQRTLNEKEWIETTIHEFQQSETCTEVQQSETCTEVQQSETCTEVQQSETCTEVQLSETCTEVQQSETCTEVQLSETCTEVQQSETCTEVQQSETCTEVQQSETSQPMEAEYIPHKLVKHNGSDTYSELYKQYTIDIQCSPDPLQIPIVEELTSDEKIEADKDFALKAQDIWLEYKRDEKMNDAIEKMLANV